MAKPPWRRQNKESQQAIRYQPALWAAIVAIAKENGVSPREQARRFCEDGVLSRGDVQSVRESTERALDAINAYREQVRRIGGNINQITMLIHAGEISGDVADRFVASIDELQPLMKEADRATVEAIHALG